MRHAECEGAFATGSADLNGEGGGIGHPGFVEFAGNTDGVAVGIEQITGKAGLGEDTQSPVQSEGESDGGVSGVELAVGHLVPDGGPTGLTHQFDFEAMLAVETRFVGEGDWRAIDQWHESDSEGLV